MRIKAVTLGFVLAGTALGSAALTIGRARGAAWIGQPLELVVPVQIDPGQADGALCAEAEVFHGDSRQDGSRVQVVVQPTDQPDAFNLKISSSALIDEPVVTVYLRAGCGQKSSRKYVLLADFPSEVTQPLSRSATPATAQVPMVVPTDSSAAGPVATQGSTNAPASAKLVISSKPAAAVAKAVPKEAAKDAPKEAAKEPPKEPMKETAKEAVKPPAPKEVAKPAAPAASAQATAKKEATPKTAESSKAVATGKPRLRLDPVETLSERVKTLESTTTASPVQDQAARDDQKLQVLQDDLKTLLDQAVKNEASLAAMRERLEKAESERVPLAVVYGLAALVALCLGALAYVWTRRPRFQQWDTPPAAVQAAAGAPAPAVAPAVATTATPAVDMDLVDLDPVAFEQLLGQSAPEKKKSLSPATESAQAHPGPVHNFESEECVDLRQEADFLVKLNRVDEALDVLATGLQKRPLESPLLYLDALAIAHANGSGETFERLRREFVQHFNATVPEFAHFGPEGSSLDASPALLDHIDSQWESPHVLDVIEACILRTPGETTAAPFDLAAFRELLNMHGVASKLHAGKA